jgi:hypothetical protein
MSVTYLTGQKKRRQVTVSKWLNKFKEETPIQGTAIGAIGGADSICQSVADELGRLWQPGTRAYLESHRPELAQEIDTAEARLNAVWLAVDAGTESLDAFKTALEIWRQANRRAIRAFAEKETPAA